MYELLIGTAVLAPSLYWTAVVAASVKNFRNDQNR